MKTYICISLALILSALPMSGQSANGASVQTRTMTIAIPVGFGQVDLPSWIPLDVQEEILRVIESLPPDELMGWSTFILVVAIVIVAGIILYCLWRCSQMIPPPAPPIPDDPSIANLPHALVYNLNPTPECELQFCTDLGVAKWLPVCVPVPPSDTMFFRLEAK